MNPLIQFLQNAFGFRPSGNGPVLDTLNQQRQQPQQHNNQAINLGQVRGVEGFYPQDTSYNPLQGGMGAFNQTGVSPDMGEYPQFGYDAMQGGVSRPGGYNGADPFGWMQHPQIQSILRTYRGM